MALTLLRFALPPSLGTERLVEHTQALRAALEDLLAIQVDVTVSQSYEALTRNLLSGAVDAAHAPPFVCAQVEPQGVTVAARAVRHGRATYGAALVKRRGADVSLSRPKGLRAAWVDPRSVAGCLLPVSHLRSARRVDPDRWFAEQTFHGSYPAALRAVLDGKADLAAVHAHKGKPDSVLEALEAHLPGESQSFEVLEVTAEVPGDGVVVGKGGDAQAVKAAFIHLEKEALGRKLLAELFHAERFEAAPPAAYRALYAVAPKDL